MCYPGSRELGRCLWKAEPSLKKTRTYNGAACMCHPRIFATPTEGCGTWLVNAHGVTRELMSNEKMGATQSPGGWRLWTLSGAHVLHEACQVWIANWMPKSVSRSILVRDRTH